MLPVAAQLLQERAAGAIEAAYTQPRLSMALQAQGKDSGSVLGFAADRVEEDPKAARNASATVAEEEGATAGKMEGEEGEDSKEVDNLHWAEA